MTKEYEAEKHLTNRERFYRAVGLLSKPEIKAIAKKKSSLEIADELARTGYRLKGISPGVLMVPPEILVDTSKPHGTYEDAGAPGHYYVKIDGEWWPVQKRGTKSFAESMVSEWVDEGWVVKS